MLIDHRGTFFYLVPYDFYRVIYFRTTASSPTYLTFNADDSYAWKFCVTEMD